MSVWMSPWNLVILGQTVFRQKAFCPITTGSVGLRRRCCRRADKVRRSYISRTVWPRIIKFYTDIHTDALHPRRIWRHWLLPGGSYRIKVVWWVMALPFTRRPFNKKLGTYCYAVVFNNIAYIVNLAKVHHSRWRDFCKTRCGNPNFPSVLWVLGFRLVQIPIH